MSDVRYRREGSCPDCNGRCCKFMSFPFKRDDDAAAWARLHPGIEVVDLGPIQVINVQSQCSALTDEGLCALYDTSERPQVCNDWPRTPADLLSVPECGYRLVPVEEPV